MGLFGRVVTAKPKAQNYSRSLESKLLYFALLAVVEVEPFWSAPRFAELLAFGVAAVFGVGGGALAFPFAAGGTVFV